MNTSMAIQATLAIAITSACYSSASADTQEFIVDAQVHAVTPLFTTRHVPKRCSPAAEPAPDDLRNWLLHDLQLRAEHCQPATTERVPSGYQVTLSWGEREFTQVMSEVPGAVVPVAVTVD